MPSAISFLSGGIPKLDDCAAPDNNTDLNASTTKHGLCPILPNTATKFLDGTGGWSTPPPGNATTAIIQDEFMTNTLGGNLYGFGSLGWYITWSGTAGSKTQIDSEVNHPGIGRLTTYTTLNHCAYARLLYTGTTPTTHLWADDFYKETFIVRTVDNTSVLLRFGFTMDETGTFFGGTDGAGFEFDTSVDSYWHCKVAHATNVSDYQTAIQPQANSWYKLDIVRVAAAQWDFYINDALVKSWTTNCPTGVAGQVCFFIATRANPGAKTVDIDYFCLQTVPLGQRWT
jgi:hypothetical protein